MPLSTNLPEDDRSLTQKLKDGDLPLVDLIKRLQEILDDCPNSTVKIGRDMLMVKDHDKECNNLHWLS